MTTSASIAAARDRFLAEHSRYEALVDEVTEQLGRELRRRGIEAEVVGRAKDVASFVTKAFRKGYTDPWTQTTDKAGVRITTFYSRDVQVALDTVLELFPDQPAVEDKRTELRLTELGYLGVHVTVLAAAGDAKVPCEIQIRTSAQGSWAVVSHHLLYKPDLELPEPVRRSLYRLLALVELFDSEVEHAMATFTSLPQFAASTLRAAAERAFYQFRTESYDQRLTLIVLDAIKGTIGDDNIAGYAVKLQEFVETHRPRISDRLDRYRGASAHPILSQPEAIILFERLENEADQLEEAWLQAFPEELLDDVRAAWGYDL